MEELNCKLKKLKVVPEGDQTVLEYTGDENEGE